MCATELALLDWIKYFDEIDEAIWKVTISLSAITQDKLFKDCQILLILSHLPPLTFVRMEITGQAVARKC